MTNENPAGDDSVDKASTDDINAETVNDAVAGEGNASNTPAQNMQDSGDVSMSDALSELVSGTGDIDAFGDIIPDALSAMQAERDQLKDQLLRALADTENTRRRAEREAASVRKYGHTPFARDLVGALDNLARAVASAPENSEDIEKLDPAVQSLVTGIKLSWTELLSVIEKHGIQQVIPLGEKFDYNLHQAMYEVPTNDQPSGTVVDVVQHCYVLHDRLLRPAMVGVSKAVDPAGNPAGNDDTQDS